MNTHKGSLTLASICYSKNQSVSRFLLLPSSGWKGLLEIIATTRKLTSIEKYYISNSELVLSMSICICNGNLFKRYGSNSRLFSTE
jgi:hypothetical protein